jgi:hypothetical protein
MKKIEKAAKVIDSYLTYKDFNSRVTLTYEDGSVLKLQYAFYIKLVDYIVVFTEHLGIFIFHKDEVISIRQMKL